MKPPRTRHRGENTGDRGALGSGLVLRSFFPFKGDILGRQESFWQR